jgi:outer membrane biosynthesis protein TonB
VLFGTDKPAWNAQNMGVFKYEATHMKIAIPTAALLLLLGTTGSAYARQDKAQDDHQQEAKPPAKQAKPPQTQAKPAEKQAKPATEAKPAKTEARTESRPAAQPVKAAKTESRPAAQPVKAARTESKPAAEKSTTTARTESRPATQPRARTTQAVSTHGRISNAHYASSFGSGHTFHVSEGDYRNHRFQYGGYSFGFLDPWPVGWGYSDNVYVVYVDGGYYMYDPIHPGVRISISIL